jgi:uncharacterized protein YdbL (DUF1318 family)
MIKEEAMTRCGKVWRSAIVLAVLAMGACVTINIYFPAEKVESVAGEIVQDVRGLKPEEDATPPKKDKSSSLTRPFLLASLTATAWAEEVTTVSNPTIRALKEQMKARYPMLKPYLQSGTLKEGADGYLAPGNLDALNLKDKRNLTGLIDAENKDRKALYQEVAKALNIDPSQTSRVAGIFATEWQKSVP